MKSSMTSAGIQALILGAVAGMRSLTAPAILSFLAARKKPAGADLDLASTPFAPLAMPGVSNTLTAMAVGEMVVDKLPFTPARTQALSVAFRVLSGAAVGSAVFAADKRHPAPGMLLGAVGAVAATYGMFEARQAVDKKLNAPDPLIGAVEDVIAIGSGLTALLGIGRR